MSIHRLFQCGLKSPKYSNHRQKAIPYIAVFQSLRSLRTATRRITARSATKRTFQSSRSLRTATKAAPPDGTRRSDFNPCGPCGPRPKKQHYMTRDERLFQSSRSLRTATVSCWSRRTSTKGFQSSRSLRTATLTSLY